MSTSNNEDVETLIKNQFILTQEQLKDFPLMNRLMEHELHEIESFTLFENSNGTGLIYVTKDDQVFGIGANGEYNLLGISGRFYKSERVDRPVRIEELCGKQIVNISMGGIIGAAINTTGMVYQWGKEHFVLDDIAFPSCVRHDVKLISCGHSILALLEKEGHVSLIGGLMLWKDREPVIYLTCGHSHVAMLSRSGNVYTWGQNQYCQRGVPLYLAQDDQVVKKISLWQPCSSVSCGSFSTFFQTKSGELWACGANAGMWGYLNVKSKQNYVKVPEKVEIKERVVKFMTASKNDKYCTYMAVTENKELLVWDGQNQGTPRLKHLNSIAEICMNAVPRNLMFQVNVDSRNDLVVKPLSKLILEKLEIVNRLCDEVRKDSHDLELVVEGSL